MAGEDRRGVIAACDSISPANDRQRKEGNGMQGGEISSPRMTKRTVLQVRVTGRYCRSNRFTTNESNENPEWSLIRIAKTVDSVVEKNRRIRTEGGKE